MNTTPRGMSFVDVVVGTAIMLMVFVAMFGAFKLSIQLVFSTKAKTGAISLVGQQIEYLRGLPYDTLGTVGGIPSGTIPQLQQKTLNNITYTIRTLIEYVDDPGDGTGNSDSNGITADYKLVKVEADWVVKGISQSTFVVTVVAPPGMESLANGGTLTINAFDANAAPVPGASIHITNPSTTPTIDITVSSSDTGTASFPGAPAAAGYRVVVSKSGYSTAQTYLVQGQNTNPNPGPLAVANKKTTTQSFAIDRTAALSVTTQSPMGAATFSDTFTDQAQLSATTSTTVSGGSLVLTGPAPYPASGTAQSVPVAPSRLAGWTSVSWHASTTAQATALVRVYYWNGTTYALVPDADLAGNSAGFATSPVSLAALPAGTYTSLELGATLATANANLTPAILDWTIDYTAGPTPLPSIAFTMHGAKNIGTSATGTPLYKVSTSGTTNASGLWSIAPLEWDTYTLALTGSTYDVMERCPDVVSVTPGSSVSAVLTLTGHTANTLKVAVSGGGNPLSNATIAVGRAGATTTLASSACGQSFFSNLSNATYTVQASAPGYQTQITNIAVSGQTELPIALSP